MEPYDPPTTVLVQRSEPQGVSTVLSSTDFFQSQRNRRVILERADSFQLRDRYLFATTTQVRGGAGGGAGELLTLAFAPGQCLASAWSVSRRRCANRPPSRWSTPFGSSSSSRGQ